MTLIQVLLQMVLALVLAPLINGLIRKGKALLGDDRSFPPQLEQIVVRLQQARAAAVLQPPGFSGSRRTFPF